MASQYARPPEEVKRKLCPRRSGVSYNTFSSSSFLSDDRSSADVAAEVATDLATEVPAGSFPSGGPWMPIFESMMP